MIPKDPTTGETLKPNPFDGRFIKVKGPTGTEGVAPTIDVENPEMDYEGLMMAYTTTLDACLQGLISPSTLGIMLKNWIMPKHKEKKKKQLFIREVGLLK